MYSDAGLLSVMRGYEQGKPVYFATPPVQLVCALQASLKAITAHPMDERWTQHRQASIALKDFVTNELGLKQVSGCTMICLSTEHGCLFRYPIDQRSLLTA